MSPTDLEEVKIAFERHLRVERNLATHSIRAYMGDLESLVNHLHALGITDISRLELSHIRSWLATMQVKGGARTSLSRRAVSIRLFTQWAFKSGLISTDVGVLLAIPKAHRTLPEVLDIPSALLAMQALATRVGEEETPIALRDCAMVEVLYASGARVAELCGLDFRMLTTSGRHFASLAKETRSELFPLAILR